MRKVQKSIECLIGLIPYNAGVKLGTVVYQRPNGIQISKGRIYLDVSVWSLSQIWKVRLKLIKPWIEYQSVRQAKQDTTISLRWKPTIGWWLEGDQTGRRIRNMPKAMPVILCIFLFQVYPKILEVSFAHAKEVQRPMIVYWIIGGATLLFVGLIVLYMCLGYKSKATGFEDALRKFADAFKNKGPENQKNIP